MGGKSKKVAMRTVITYLCLGLESWTMAIAWQEHVQDVCERLGVAGRAEVECHSNGLVTELVPHLDSASNNHFLLSTSTTFFI